MISDPRQVLRVGCFLYGRKQELSASRAFWCLLHIERIIVDLLTFCYFVLIIRFLLFYISCLDFQKVISLLSLKAEQHCSDKYNKV